MENQIALADTEKIGAILDDAAVHLDADQIHALPYLAHGMSVSKVASITGVAVGRIDDWKGDNSFATALARLSSVIGEWHAQQIQLLGIKAWEVMWETLGQDYASLEEKEKAEVARTARFVIDAIKPDHSTRHVVHEVISPELNISEGTVDVLARRVRELELGPKDTVEGEYRIEEVPSIYVCHPDTDFGVVNYDESMKKYQCHICGNWHVDFIDHIETSHSMGRKQYLEIFHIKDAMATW